MKIFYFSFAVVLVISPGAQADNHGAIAFDRAVEAWGTSWDHHTQDEADKVALSKCAEQGKHCEIVVRVTNTCGAYATGKGNASGWGTGNRRAIAERWALKYCREDAEDCTIQGWVCNSDTAECAQQNVAKSGCEDRNSSRRIQGDSYQEACPPGCP